MENTLEKRRAERKEEDCVIRFEGDNFSIYSRMLDVSDYGAFVATNYLLDPGTQVNIYLNELPGTEDRRVATVVHSNSSKDKEGRKIMGLGLEFVSKATN